MTSYLTSMNTISLSRNVFEIFDFEIFRVWPWPLTPRGHLGSKNLIHFESPYMASYSTSMDTISLSRTVLEIFDFKVFRVWLWPLTPKNHLGSKIFIPFESPYMTSYLTSMNTISLSRTVFEIMPVKILKAEQNGGFWPFQGQGHWPIFSNSRKGSDSHQTASNDVLRVKIGSAVWAAPSSKSVKSWKKRTNPYLLGMCTSVRENFSETKFFAIIQVDDVINRAKYFFNRFIRVSLAGGQTLLFSV